MKYILMMQYPRPGGDTPGMDQWSPAEVDAHMEHLRLFREEFTASGEMIVTHALAGPDDARMVRARQGAGPEVTDGPFPETKEFLAGYVIVDVDKPDRAYYAASRWSEGPGPGGAPLNLPVEVRRIMWASGEEM